MGKRTARRSSKVNVSWKSSLLRGLYPAYANGNTYLCQRGTGETRGVVFRDGSGWWGLRTPIRGPRYWRQTVSGCFKVVVVFDGSTGFCWEIRHG